MRHTAATVTAAIQAINAASTGTGYSCKHVSWEDAQRGTVGGALSCWGGNISDVRLWEKGGKLLYTLRSDNWNERLGYVSSDDVAVVTGNHVSGGGATPTPRTLSSYLKAMDDYGSYAGLKSGSLFCDAVDDLFTIRFQTVFLPIADTETVEFCSEVYNYNTRRDDNPRNLLLLATPQGTSVQQDGHGAQKVFYHTVDKSDAVHRHWLEAERSMFGVGTSQVETTAEAQAAAARGKATAVFIGTKPMGTRFNVQMLIQLPLHQGVLPRTEPTTTASGYRGGRGGGGRGGGLAATKRSRCSDGGRMEGVSNAARVSVGTDTGVWGGVAKPNPKRDATQHGTITVTTYYTVAGGVPSPEDVTKAIDDLNNLYGSCHTTKPLAQCHEVTKELTVKDAQDVQAKIVEQPYAPQPAPPADNSKGFPQPPMTTVHVFDLPVGGGER